VIVIDANLLLYAYDSESPRHDRARRWLDGVLGEEADVRFALTTILAFIRIGTDHRVFRRPLDPAEAIGIVGTWLSRSNAALAEPTDRHWPIFAELGVSGQARGPGIMDAHIAALAIEHGATLMTTDRDFARFARLRFRDPLVG
jgi:toxin-antitoxin system PIN domain toxin